MLVSCNYILFSKITKEAKSMSIILNKALSIVFPFVPVAGSAYEFAKTCVKVYNATSPSKALIAGVKGIVIDSYRLHTTGY